MKITIVDDHILVLNGLTTMLRSCKHVEVITSYTSGEEFLGHVDIDRPDVVLLDIDLPDISGLEICSLLSRHHPEVAVLALSNFNESGLIKSIIQSGARGYLLKNCSKEELIEGLESVTKGQLYMSQAISEQLLRESVGQNNAQSFIPRLTRREKEVLEAISDELANKEIAEKLFISVKTVEAHRTNLLQKFGVKNTAGLIKQAYQKGLL